MKSLSSTHQCVKGKNRKENVSSTSKRPRRSNSTATEPNTSPHAKKRAAPAGTGAEITWNKRNKRQKTKQLEIKTNPKWPKTQCFSVPAERPQKRFHSRVKQSGSWEQTRQKTTSEDVLSWFKSSFTERGYKTSNREDTIIWDHFFRKTSFCGFTTKNKDLEPDCCFALILLGGI